MISADEAKALTSKNADPLLSTPAAVAKEVRTNAENGFCNASLRISKSIDGEVAIMLRKAGFRYWLDSKGYSEDCIVEVEW